LPQTGYQFNSLAKRNPHKRGLKGKVVLAPTFSEAVAFIYNSQKEILIKED